MSALRDAKSETEVDDVDAKFQLQFPAEVHGDGFRPYKRLKREEPFYSNCRKAGLCQVARRFGFNFEQFGLQVSSDNTILGDPEETPEEMASDFTCAEFETPQSVLIGARHMAALEISCEPRVRNYVRSKYLDILELSTHPKTPDGNAIDCIFQRKPLHRLGDAQWLLVQKAEEDNLINVTFELPEDQLNKLLSDFEKFYLRASVSKSAQLWNEQRKLILQNAIFDFLLPLMEKEARSLLTSRAKNWLLMEYGKALWDKVSMAPAYQHKENEIKSDDEASASPRVMACCWGQAEGTLVMLDSYGELLDVLCIGSFSWESFNYTENCNDTVTWLHNYYEKKRVLKFVTDHQPSVVVIGAVNMSCTLIRQLMFWVRGEVSEKTKALCPFRIVYGDESLGRLYENSQTSSNQLPGQSDNVKRAVALGRYLQNPLAMVATLCGPGRDILSWKLLSSPFEDILTPDEKYKVTEQVMVDVTNQVGLDINLAISHEWLFAPLQFISGLGPRKAAHLQQSLVRSGCTISNQREFVTLHQLGEKEYDNAVSFLRVRLSSRSGKQFRDLLDDTRIHPESYILAEELVKDVYDGIDALECIWYRPGYLERLDIEAYARSKQLEDKVQTLYDIRKELIQGFRDPRKEYEEPSVDELFHLLTGLTDDAICEGRIVQATVYSVCPIRASCNTELGLRGALRKADFSDHGRRTKDLSKKLKKGDIITCKIKTVKKRHFEACLSSL